MNGGKSCPVLLLLAPFRCVCAALKAQVEAPLDGGFSVFLLFDFTLFCVPCFVFPGPFVLLSFVDASVHCLEFVAEWEIHERKKRRSVRC
jgi:hypothetical protein